MLLNMTTDSTCSLFFRVQFAPEVDVSKPKRIFEVSDDGLVLTIKKMNEKRVGQWF